MLLKGLHNLVYVLAIMLMFFSLPAYAEWAEQSCSFPHRIPVTLNTGAMTQTEEVRVELENADFPASYTFSASGNDVRVFEDDDITPIDFVVTDWDAANRRAIIYIRKTIPASSAETIYIYFGDGSLGSGGAASIVFPDVGLRLRSRVSTTDPVSAADGLAAFEAATVDVDDSVRASVTGLNNQALGGANSNYGWCVSAVINVTSANTGTWGFRYGGDFGHGGHLFVGGQSLEEDWNDNLWWAGNYANTGETLEGTVFLSEGWHRYEALGFEDCCDGPVGFQAQAPGGPWEDLSSANFTMRAAQCISPNVTVVTSAAESCSTVLEATKSVNMDGASVSDYAIPGATLRYDLNVQNPGQTVSSGSLSLTDVFPPDVALVVGGPAAFTFTDGAFPSGLSFSYGGAADTGDSVEFSVDGTDFSYVPTSPVDANVTHVRFNPTGALGPNDSGDKPEFTISLKGQVL